MKVTDWINEVEQYNKDGLMSKMLIGNKKDLDNQRQVTFEEAKELADHYNIKYIETSAKSSENVEEAFKIMALEIKGRISQNAQAQNT